MKLRAVIFATMMTAIGCGDDEIKVDASPPAIDAAQNTIDAGSTIDATVTPDADPNAPDADLTVPDAQPAPDAMPAAKFAITEILYDPTGTDDGMEWVEITNVGNAMGDLGSHRLCGANFAYHTLPANIQLAPGASVVVHWNTSGTDGTPAGHYYTGNITAMGNSGAGADKSMAVYKPTGSFNQASAILTYVQWGAGGQAREDVANTAAVWTTGDFVPGVAEGSSICFNGGDPTKPAGYSADPSPTPMAANGSCD